MISHDPHRVTFPGPVCLLRCLSIFVLSLSSLPLSLTHSFPLLIRLLLLLPFVTLCSFHYAISHILPSLSASYLPPSPSSLPIPPPPLHPSPSPFSLPSPIFLPSPPSVLPSSYLFPLSYLPSRSVAFLLLLLPSFAPTCLPTLLLPSFSCLPSLPPAFASTCLSTPS